MQADSHDAAKQPNKVQCSNTQASPMPKAAMELKMNHLHNGLVLQQVHQPAELQTAMAWQSLVLSKL